MDLYRSNAKTISNILNNGPMCGCHTITLVDSVIELLILYAGMRVTYKLCRVVDPFVGKKIDFVLSA